MIIKDTATLRKHISVNGSVEYQNIAPYLKKAERKFLSPLIGKEQLKIFEQDQTDEIIKQAQDLAQEAVANFGYYLNLPIGAVHINNSGIHVVDNDNAKPASDKQFKELQRSFKKAGHEALDELLDLMEQYPDRFMCWFNSNYYTVYKELLVNKTATFNKYFYLFNSRQTFIAMKPTIKVVEDQFISPIIGKVLLAELKKNQTIKEREEVKILLKQSIVAFTIMKTVDNGMFVLDAKGIYMRFDTLPYEKVSPNIKANTFLIRTKESKQIEAEEYLKLALKVIEDHSNKFPEYTIKAPPDHLKIINTKSIVSV